MLNRTTFSQNVSAHIASAPPPPLAGVGWRPIADMLRLPTTARGFFAFLLSLLALAGVMAIHVMLSAEMMRLELRLDELRETEMRIQRQNANLLWQIARNADAEMLYEKALAAGYTPIKQRVYVIEQPTPSPIPVNAAENSQAADASASSQPDGVSSNTGWRAWLSALTDPATWPQWFTGE